MFKMSTAGRHTSVESLAYPRVINGLPQKADQINYSASFNQTS